MKTKTIEKDWCAWQRKAEAEPDLSKRESAWPVFRKLFSLPSKVNFDLPGDLVTEDGSILLAMVAGSRRDELRAMRISPHPKRLTISTTRTSLPTRHSPTSRRLKWAATSLARAAAGRNIRSVVEDKSS